jgi:hypothetical protein
VPAAFTQTSVKVSVPLAVGFRVCVPLLASVPLQLPDAVQAVALLEDQVMVVEAPAAMDVAAKVSVGGAGGAATVKLAVLAADVPNALVQVSE